jgi:iron complex transport system ATP-binding protein
LLKAKNITYRIDNKTLLSDVSLEFKPGEFTVIMGQNGAGKSTLLRILAGSTRATDGEVSLYGKRIETYKEIELARIRAVLSQHYEISFPVSINDIVMMGRYPHFKSEPSGKDYEIADKALSMMGIYDLKNRNYDTLSGGEAQKVQMARVLSQIWEHDKDKSKILFLDEPVSQLDIQYQYFLLQAARNFTKENVMVVAILHDLNLAINYADNIIFLKNGSLVKSFNSVYDIDKEIVNKVFDIEMENLRNPFSDKPHFVVKGETRV